MDHLEVADITMVWLNLCPAAIPTANKYHAAYLRMSPELNSMLNYFYGSTVLEVMAKLLMLKALGCLHFIDDSAKEKQRD